MMMFNPSTTLLEDPDRELTYTRCPPEPHLAQKTKRPSEAGASVMCSPGQTGPTRIMLRTHTPA